MTARIVSSTMPSFFSCGVPEYPAADVDEVTSPQ
jgi:hypothetical protein